MGKIIRHQFLGSWMVFWFMAITGVGVPLAVLYLLENLVTTSTEMDDPEAFVKRFVREREEQRYRERDRRRQGLQD